MRFGYWMPVFGGWLRNVRDEQMSVDWPYLRALAVESEQAGFDLSLIAELNLNDIKGHRAPSLDAWTLAPAVAAVTERLELMLAVRPNYHSPSLTAKAVSTLETIAPGRTSLNVVSSWWKDEATQYGAPFDVHDARYERTDEWLEVFSRLMVEPEVTHTGPLYELQGCVLEPKPAVPPTVYMGGESPKAKEVISRRGSAYVMHGDPPEVIAEKVRDMTARADRPFQYGVSGYVIVRDSEAQAQDELARILDVQADPEAYASYQDFVAGSQLESQVSLAEYSVSNRGLRAGLVGTPAQVTERIRAYEDAGVDLMLLQFSPQREEMARFGRDVIAAY
jgi:FMNH2-dependent dimethyl sulfone monooxygenase